MTSYKAYQYLFYRIYVWYEKKFGEKEMPYITASSFSGMFVLLNLVTLVFLIQLITGIRLVELFFESGYNVVIVISFVVVAEVVNYYVLFRKKKYLKLIKEFKKETTAENKRNLKLCYIYTLGSILALFLVSFALSFYK